MMDENCGNCKFFKRFSSTSHDGLCRLEPPKVSRLAQKRPRVYLDDWCGQWKKSSDSERGEIEEESE